MKKKILLIIMMFMFITNVNALTFNVDVTNIEDEGNNGTIGSIEKIDLENKELDVLFQDIGDEVSFSITVTNSGDRAGTLRSIDVTSSNDKIEYTSNLPDGGLAINGNDTNKVIVTAKVKEGAVNGKTTSEVKIKYTYDEGSCPDGEILSEDESMCLCPEGMERNENGICVTPEKKIECAPGEIYNETKKICEKKVVPVNPSNPKTLDNIILITLLFFVSGLGIYAVIFKKLDTNKKKVTGAAITGVITLTLSFTVLASVFGLDNLLSAIVNPITKSKELVVTVNEEIDLIETWDGECSLDVSELTPDNIFQGGSGTESDPYQVKTAEQLSCFAKSVNEGTTYEGQYIKQTKNIKLNNNLNEQATSGDLSNVNLWTSAGYRYWDDDSSTNIIKPFSGNYDGDNHIISGLYITNDSVSYNQYAFKGMFGHTKNATLKNMILSDVYINTTGNTGSLVGIAMSNLTLDNINTYGIGMINGWDGAGIVSNYDGEYQGTLTIENTTNNINLTCGGSGSGIIHRVGYSAETSEPSIILRNNTNNGNITYTNSPSGTAGLFGYFSTSSYVIGDNNVNHGNLTGTTTSAGQVAGIMGYISARKADLTNSYNTGNITGFGRCGESGMLYGSINFDEHSTIDNSYNSGNFTPDPDKRNDDYNYYFGGIVGYARNVDVINCYNTGDFDANVAESGIAGIVGLSYYNTNIENCYNTGNITSRGYIGGILGQAMGQTTITKTYNTGTITSIQMNGGIVGYGGNETTVTYSYNTGEIINNGAGNTAGICGQYCTSVKNCYNTGNITSTNHPIYIAGITGTETHEVENVYNSGNILFTNAERYGNSGYIAGITGNASGGTVKNAYNLGNVTFHTITIINGYEPNPHVDGVATYAQTINTVNAGTITLKVDEPLGTASIIQMNGVSYNSATNGFNAGNIVIDDSALDTPIAEDGLSHSIRIGQITEQSGTGNKWNTDPSGHATGCLGIWTTCTQEKDEAVGSYTTDEAPDILSIINGDDAFEILEGETLPTLKVFNE